MNSNNLLTIQESINLKTPKDNSDISIRNKRNSITEFSSPLIDYYNSSNEYLNRKLSENNYSLNIKQSNNFIRKDSLCQNERQTFYNSNEEDNSSEDNNNIENINNYTINNEINDTDYEEYNQLQSNGIYYQIYQDKKINPNNQIVYNNNTNSNKVIQLNQNQENQMNLQQNQIMYFNIINQFNLINNNLNHRPRYNSTHISNENNFLPPIFTNNMNNINNNINNNNNGEIFRKKGWVCNYCNNFNYESRNKCNRCKQPKNPNLKSKKKNGNGIGNINKTNIYEKKGSKQFSEREGDWICFNCKNVNFAFRIICNRCQLPKIESEKLIHLNFNLITNNKIESKLN